LSGESRIVFRDFSVCAKRKCKADIVAKNFFYLDYGDGFVKISFENEIYSTIVGAKLFINNNDDVASENNVPFGIYEFSALTNMMKFTQNLFSPITKQVNHFTKSRNFRDFLKYYNQLLLILIYS
jgi:hypothetical protein